MSTKKGKYGDPKKRKPATLFQNKTFGDLMKDVQPNGNFDPRKLGGSMSGPGGPLDRDAVLIDTTDVVLLESTEVSVLEVARRGAWDGRVTYLQMAGRINKTDRQVQVGFVCDTDGVAALITELLALAHRDGVDMLDDVTRRLSSLHQEKNVDLHWLKAAIENAIELSEEANQ